MCSAFRALRCVLCALLLALCAVPVARGQEAPIHVVEEGDTLYSIARQHGLSVQQLQRLNDLTGTTIHPGQKLVVGTAEEREEENDSTADSSTEEHPPPPEERSPATTPRYGAHTAETGATFYTIAARYGASVDSIAALNDSVGTFLKPGDTVRLPASLGPPTHRVEEGEAIYDVARRYGVSAKLLQRTNGLESKHISAGQYLRIPGRSAPEPRPPGTRPPVRETGPVARYPSSYEGRLMAGGQTYDPQRFTVSHPALPLGTVVLLTQPDTRRHAFAVVADRGPLDEQYVMDVSAAVFERLGLREGSEQPVEVRVMD